MRLSGLLRSPFLIAGWLGAGRVLGAGLFLSPAVTQVEHQGSEIGGGSGSSIALGLTWGPTLSQEIDLIWSQSPWSMGDPGEGLGDPARTGDGNAVSLLASYRYFLGHSTDRIRPYVGAWGGRSRISGHVATSLSGQAYAGSAQEWVGAYGGLAGFTLALGRIVSLDLGYRYLQTRGLDYDTNIFGGSAGYTDDPGPRVHFDRLKTHGLQLALKIRL